MYFAPRHELFFVGLVGTASNFLFGLLVLHSFAQCKSKQSVAWYVSLSLLLATSFELVYYAFIMYHSSYSSLKGLAFKILSELFQFLALMVVCSCWIRFLKIKGFWGFFFSRLNLMVTTGLLSTFYLYCFIKSLIYTSATRFYSTNTYYVLVLDECLQAVFFGISLMVLSFFLLRRFRNYLSSANCNTVAHQTALKKFLVNISLISLSNSIIIVMVVLVLLDANSVIRLTNRVFSAEGLIWVALVDIIPFISINWALLDLVTPVKRKTFESDDNFVESVDLTDLVRPSLIEQKNSIDINSIHTGSDPYQSDRPSVASRRWSYSLINNYNSNSLNPDTLVDALIPSPSTIEQQQPFSEARM